MRGNTSGTLRMRTTLAAVVFAGGLPTLTKAAPVAGEPLRAAAPSATTPAAAPTPGTANTATAIDDIVVTATRRESSLQRTPLAVTALTGATLQERNIVNVQALAQSVPTMQIGANVGVARVAIRGIGLDSTAIGAEGRVAYHLDGIYLARPRAIFGTYFDISRIEVVRGPQGTLYGRNATGGAVNVITNDPDMDKVSGFVRAGFGNYDTITTEAAVSVPLSGTLAVRVAEQTIDQNRGFGQDLYTGTDVNDRHSHAVRVKLKWRPAPSFTAVLSADYNRVDDANFTANAAGPGVFNGTGQPGSPFVALVPIGVALGGTIAPNPRDTNSETPTADRMTTYGAAATLTWNLGWSDITSLTGYRHLRSTLVVDNDTTQAVGVPFRIFEAGDEVTQELRLAGSSGAFNWLLGGFVMRDHANGFVAQQPLSNIDIPLAHAGGPAFASLGILSGGQQQTNQEAVFAQGGVKFLQAFTLNLGARVSHEERKANQFVANLTNVPAPAAGVPLPYPFGTTSVPVGTLPCPQPSPGLGQTVACQGSRSYNSFLPRVNLEYQATPNIYFYVTYAKGDRSGSFSLGALGPALDPEKITDYEGGFRTRWLDGALTLNGTVFRYDYINLQLTQRTPLAAITIAAPSARTTGVELEAALRLGRHIRFDANGSILDAKFQSFFAGDASFPGLGVLSLQGQSLPQAPRYTANVGGEYLWDAFGGQMTVRAEGVFVGRTDFAFANQPFTAQLPYTKVNAFVNYATPDGHWLGQAWVRNLNDKRTYANIAALNPVTGGGLLPTYDPPRTFGVSVTRNF